MYCFQKKDGTVKKYYKESIDYILTATVQKHEIMVGRSDEVGKIYECYTTKRKRFLEPKRNTIQSKIIDICAEFGCYTNPWYSGYQEISLELHGDNVEFIYEFSSRLLNAVEKNNVNITDELFKIGGIEYVNIVRQNDEVSN